VERKRRWSCDDCRSRNSALMPLAVIEEQPIDDDSQVRAEAAALLKAAQDLVVVVCQPNFTSATNFCSARS
jgi:hypothetical protein